MSQTYGYARVSTDGQTLDAQVAQLRAAGAERVFKEAISGTKRERLSSRSSSTGLSPRTCSWSRAWTGSPAPRGIS